MTGARRYAVVAALVLGALVLAWFVRFGCDDAFISYVYSRSLVYGDGLTWFGEPIEGYTNFAWVLWNAIGIAIDIDPLRWSWFSTLGALAIVLILTHRIAKVRNASETTALCTVALLATNYTFLAYGTSGLETMAQCALLTGAYLQVERLRRTEGAPGPRGLALLSLLAALALWTRLDSAIYLAVLGVVTARHLVRVRASVLAWIAAIGPALVLVGGWLGWKLSFYGELLPNTFYAKVDVSGRTMLFGAQYIGWFITEYGLFIGLAGAIAISIARRTFTAKLPLVVVLAWCAYIIYAGGDFMEFRFIVPIMPLLFLVVAESTTAEGAPLRLKSWLRAVLLVAIGGSFSLKHAVSWKGGHLMSVDTIGGLRSFYGVVENNDWSKLGTPLGDVLHDTGAVIACNGAGAIPYYADLPTVDQLGLNDRWIAKHGAKPSSIYVRPGHQRFATQEYLAQRGVNLVIGTPRLTKPGHITYGGVTPGIATWIAQLLGPTNVAVNELVIVAAPIAPDRSMLLWYSQPTDAITARIRAAGWEMRAFYPHRRPPTP